MQNLLSLGKNALGISGIQTSAEVEQINKALDSTDTQSIQILLGYSFQFGKNNAELALSITPPKDGAVNVLHFSDYDSESLFKTVIEVLETNALYKKKICGAIQINNGASNATVLKDIKKKYPELQIIYSLHSLLQTTTLDFTEQLTDIEPHITAFLFDSSGGTGIPIHFENAMIQAKRLQESFPNILIGFAGGLNEINIQNFILKTSAVFAMPFFVDAESGLRDSAKMLDTKKMLLYVQSGVAAFQSTTGEIEKNSTHL